MSTEILKNLEGLDFTKLTLDDVKSIKNPALRTALLSALLRPTAEASHQNHNSHSDSSGILDSELGGAAQKVAAAARK
jgi:hypothetical protein